MPNTENIVINTGPIIALVAALSSVSLARHVFHYRAVDYSLPGQAMILMDHPRSTDNHCQVTLIFSSAVSVWYEENLILVISLESMLNLKLEMHLLLTNNHRKGQT